MVDQIALLDEQKSTLVYQLTELKKANEKSKRVEKLSTESEVASTKKENEHDDLVKIMEGEVENPFIPHQQVFNKFSIMVSHF